MVEVVTHVYQRVMAEIVGLLSPSSARMWRCCACFGAGGGSTAEPKPNTAAAPRQTAKAPAVKAPPAKAPPAAPSPPRAATATRSAATAPADPNAEFDAAVARARAMPSSAVPNESKLRMYALYKQSTHEPGAAEPKAPSRFNPVARAKWDAWDAVRGMGRDEARRAYVKLVQSF